jgi:hypothetical protein
MLHTTEVRERDNPLVQFVHHQYNISISDIGAPNRLVTRTMTNPVICKWEGLSSEEVYVQERRWG